MSAQKHEFDINILHEVYARPILWYSRLEEYKESDKKPPQWLEIADKLASTPGHCVDLFVRVVLINASDPNHKSGAEPWSQKKFVLYAQIATIIDKYISVHNRTISSSAILVTVGKFSHAH